jgi:hypothetical protein
LTAGILLLGAFFAITPSSLNVFADVSPDMLNFTSGSDDGVLHSGDVLTDNKTVIMNTTLIPLFNVTWNVYQEGTSETCGDLVNPNESVLKFTTLNQTELLNAGNHSKTLNFTETFVGMPGVYRCTTVFEAVNATNSADREFLGNQTVWIDAIGSKGYWKNHPNATEQHLPITLSDKFTVETNVTATNLFKEHKGKFDLDKLAAQLLAAKLNIWALNMTEPQPNDKVECIAGNVTAAEDLLTAKGYDQIGGGETMTGKDKKPALDIHKNLDLFNNYGCPLSEE